MLINFFAPAKHALMKLARRIDWRFLEERFGASTRPSAVADAAIDPQRSYDLSDEALCDRWVENREFQYFCGEESFQHALVFDRLSLPSFHLFLPIQLPAH